MLCKKLNAITHDKVLLNYPLKSLNTFKVGGNAKYLIEPTSLNSLVIALRYVTENDIDFLMLGNGSNLLISDHGFDGLVISTKKLNKIHYENGVLYAETGVTVGRLLSFCLKNKIGGYEFLSGIPATIGGLISTGAGAFNKNFLETIKEIGYFDGKVKKTTLERLPVKNDDIYRKGLKDLLGGNPTFLFATLTARESQTVREDIADYLKRRKGKPMKNCCGSVFKNPKNDFAGRLIESVNLKGKRIGGASVSDLHANYIINDGTATASDIYSLINLIKNTVLNKTGVLLNLEVRTVGDFDDING